jgi:Protein of unknown function (DUF3014)
LVISGAIGYVAYTQLKPKPPAVIPSTPVVVAPTVTAPVEQFPITALQEALTTQPSDPLPDLFSSDSFVADLLTALLNNPQAMALLVSEHRIARFVAFVDALPTRKIGMNLWPIKPATGSFQVEPDHDVWVISDVNESRYDSAVLAFTQVDVSRVVETYVRLYPLLQQAYRELGYPQGHFNDRLIEVIDHLLAAPEPSAPLHVVLGDKGYEYVDADLEAASAGHKFLLRIGPSHSAAVKTRLRVLREALTKP